MFTYKNGFTVIEILLVVLVITLLGFAGWTWWQTSQTENGSAELDNAANEQEESAQNDEANGSGSPIFQARELNAGDQVGAMEVVSVEKASNQANDQELSDNNVLVVFEGEITVSGTYAERTGLQEGACLENLDDASQDKLPRVEGDERRNFCFSNEDEAETQLGGNEGQQVTVAVDDYNYVHYPSEVTNTARLVGVE